MKFRILLLAILASMAACSREKAAGNKDVRTDLSPMERMAALNTNFVKMLLLDEWPAHAQDYPKFLADGCQKRKDPEFELLSLEASNAALVRFGPDRPLTERQALAIGAITMGGVSVKDAALFMSKENVASGMISTGELERLYLITTEEYEKHGLKRKDLGFERKR